VSREILIQVQKRERLVAIIENGRVDDFYIEADRYQSLLGNIYKGKVESILPSINAAFVNIGQERNGFLYLTDVVSPRVDKDQELEPRTFLDKIFKKPKQEEKKSKKIVVVSVSTLLAEAIKRIHQHESISSLFSQSAVEA